MAALKNCRPAPPPMEEKELALSSPKWNEWCILNDREILAVEVYHAALLAKPKAQGKREHLEFLQCFRHVYLGPYRDDAERQMWQECKAACGDSLRTVLVPEQMEDLGGLAERAATPARVFGQLMDQVV